LIKEDRLVQIIAEAALDEKASDVVILDVNKLTVIADYFVIASGRSTLQVRSIAQNVEKRLAEVGIFPTRREGLQEGKWVILDYSSVILHVFRQEERDYYDLENLWADAGHVVIEDQAADLK
jgi:ribosome-associated protein